MADAVEIIVHCPPNREGEKSYVLQHLLQDRLGLSTQLLFESRLDYRLEVGTHLIVWPDVFFCSTEPCADYNPSHLPDKPEWLAVSEHVLESYPVFYGEASISRPKNVVHLGFDLVGVLFFLLSRWEELLEQPRDHYDRYIDSNSYLIQQSIHLYPIVDMLEATIRSVLSEMGVTKLIERSYTVTPTHDIDVHRYFRGPWSWLKTTAGDLIRRRRIDFAYWTLQQGLERLISKRRDPWDNLERLLSGAEAHGLQSVCYFIPEKDEAIGASYHLEDPEIKSNFSRLSSKGHIIGLHPPLRSYTNPRRLKEVRMKLQEAAPTEHITHSRQHFLQFRFPETVTALAYAGIKEDSSMHFREHPGFRCGTSVRFPLFDFKQRQASEVWELPLLFMDQNLHYSHDSTATIIGQVDSIIKRVQNVKGNFCFLWHNSSFGHPQWRELEHLYEEILRLATSHD